jgi:hypothetical protein
MQKHISHLSGEYRLEVIIADDRLSKQLRKFIANAHVSFRHSLAAPQPTELQYQQPSIIMTEAPPSRIDPPAMFTFFVTALIILLFVIFLYGLNYQKANLSLFPSDGAGLTLNVVFLGSLGLVLVMLFKFWVSWTFIETFQYFLIVSKIEDIQFCLSHWPPTMPSCISARSDCLTRYHHNILAKIVFS